MSKSKEIDPVTLKASRDLDALVAEKVMGLKVVEDPISHRGMSVGEAGPRGADLKRYSTVMAAAWEVVEKIGLFRNCRSLHEAGVGVKEGATWTRTGWRWEVVQELGPGEFEVVAFADTAPLAICYAALRVVEDGEK